MRLKLNIWCKCIIILGLILTFKEFTLASYGYIFNDYDYPYVADSDWYNSFDFRTSNLGSYEVKVTAIERPYYDTLPIEKLNEQQKIDYTNKFPKSTWTKVTQVDNLAPMATYGKRYMNKVDVVFAIGSTNQFAEAQNSIGDFTTMLSNPSNYIDLQVETTETNSVTAETSFPWEVHNLYNTGFGSGDGQFSPNGNSYWYKGYGSEAPIDYLYYDDGKPGVRTFTFDIDMTGYNSCATVIPGFLFGCYMDGTEFKGYLACMWHDKVGVYEFVSKDGKNGLCKKGIGNLATAKGTDLYTRGSVTFTKVYDNNTVTAGLQKKMVFAYEAGQLKVTDKSTGGNGVEIVNIECLSEGNGYGVAAINSSHGCGARSYTKFNNFKLETITVKSLADSLSNLAWRENTTKIIIHIVDNMPLESKSDEAYTETIAKLLSDDTYLINLGTTTNYNFLHEMIGSAITKPDGSIREVFFNNNCKDPKFNQDASAGKDISDSMDLAANWIIQLFPVQESDVDWVLVGDQIYWNTLYNDNDRDVPLNFGEHSITNTDTNRKQPQDNFDDSLVPTYALQVKNTYIDSKIQAEKWRYRHFEDFFDNNLGKASYSGSWLQDPEDIFTKPGKYRVNYKRRDNPFYEDSSLTNLFDSYRRWSTNYDDLDNVAVS